MIPQVVANYHARREQQENPNSFDRFHFEQPMNYDENPQVKFDFPSYQMAPAAPPSYSLSTTNQFQPSNYQFDLNNNNNNYANGQIHSTYPFTSAPTTPLPSTTTTGTNVAVVPTQTHQHVLLAGRFSGGNPTSMF